MKNELMAQVLPILEKTKEGILKAVEIVQAEMPELIEQVLAWNFALSLIGFIIGLAFLVLGIKLIKPVHKYVKEDCDDFFCYFGCAIPLVIGLIAIFKNLEWLQILIAPKLFLIEYITKLVN